MLKKIDDICHLLMSVNYNGEMPLHEACSSGHFRIVIRIIKTVKLKDDKIKDPFKKLLPKLLKATNDDKKTPFHLACQEGHVEVIKRILNHISDDTCQYLLQQTDKEENLPFHLACKNNHTEVADILIKKTKKITETRSEDGLSALHVAVQLDNLQLVQLLIEGVRVNGDLVRGLDVNLPDSSNCTPLHHAAKLGSSDAFSLLRR